MHGTHSSHLSNETFYQLALLSVKGVGSATASKLSKKLGSAELVFRASENHLIQSGINPKIAAEICAFKPEDMKPCVDWLEEEGNHLVTQQSPFYPNLLKQISNPPLALFAVGNLELLATPQIAMVGTRNPTASGLSNASEFAKSLVEAGYTITSGLAIGIDGESHRSALQNGGNTIAVMGTGPDRVFPAHHRELAHLIAQNGLIVSERLPGSRHDQGAFPQRNRIIAGLSLGTLVVEAAKKSGTLITANLSAESGREVFAIPGSIHSSQSKGCHKLIKQGAKLVECLEDILEDLPSASHKSMHISQTENRPPLSEGDAAFLNNIDFEVTSVDSIVTRSQLTVDAVTNKLLTLELQGWVLNSTGGYIRR